MEFAFCLFKYFPFGGLQRDFLRIAKVCLDRGHGVDVYAGDWQGEIPDGLRVTLLPSRRLTNHRRCASFAAKAGRCLAEENYDTVVGFNKMPGLNVYFAADTCFTARAFRRSFLFRLSGRCRTYMRLERAVFDRESKTEILLISEREKTFFKTYFKTPEKRFHLLPPGIAGDCLAPANAAEVRADLRRELSIGEDQNVLLMVGSAFKTKGVDRAISSLTSLPSELFENTVLLIVGDDNPKPFKRLARRSGVEDRVRFIGGREDVSRFLVSADLLVHPAYLEAAGMVLIEAMAAGLPVLVSAVCGYCFHVERAGAGEIIPSPFRQKTFNKMLTSMLLSEKREKWRHNGMAYIKNTDVFSLPEKAADIIERVASG
ncbi:MAG: glycosyltransferase family 4 protein [Desulfobacterales bacterium]|nr:glycosyltransferase family 4 protein [Desulfobacterales bacterium]